MKNLKDLAWNVSEEVYRADPAISYSTLSFFERKGFRYLPDLDKKVDASYFRHGSLVDCLLTDPESFEERFYVSDVSRPSDTIAKMVEDILDTTKLKYSSLEEVPNEILLKALNDQRYYLNWADKKRVEYLIEKGGPFYELTIKSQGKSIIDNNDLSLAKDSVSTLKTNDYTAKYFVKNPYKKIDHLYQLKFKIPYKNGAVRCMYDLILVDHENKVIIPIDLKTTGKDEEEFEGSFIDFKYILQAQLYTYILKNIIDLDEYFKDFRVEFYRFIVINKFNKTPLVWIFEDNHHDGDFMYQGETIRGWKSIYEDLVFHLDNKEFKYPKEIIEKGEIKIKNISIKTVEIENRQKQELEL